MIEILTKEQYENLPLQEDTFEEYYEQFETVGDMVQDKGAWEETWQYFYNFTNSELEIVISETKEDINAYTLEQQRVEVIRCATDFLYFCHKYFNI